VLLPVLPGAEILPPVRPLEGSDPVLLIVHVLPLVFPAVSPFGCALAVHLVVLPVALVLPVFAPDVDA
jgi:hypothetical protein